MDKYLTSFSEQLDAGFDATTIFPDKKIHTGSLSRLFSKKGERCKKINKIQLRFWQRNRPQNMPSAS